MDWFESTKLGQWAQKLDWIDFSSDTTQYVDSTESFIEFDSTQKYREQTKHGSHERDTDEYGQEYIVVDYDWTLEEDNSMETQVGFYDWYSEFIGDLDTQWD